ncbi:MAG: tRNA (guanosine(46)-N7)-methyltransferase TrmB [Bacteroidales bacterium]|nr:tRNA (guanosine(46)-N7)-methyltransferase TrmB [Bacteroidales bacterium]
MGHDKLRKFAENETFACLKQPSSAEVLLRTGEPGLHLRDHALKGRWNADVFGNSNPIVLELGCGKGDYTVALSGRFPEKNFIGVDIKGARLWKGAKYVTENAVTNAAFLRTRVEFLEAFFAPGEVSEIWLTFSDPQLKSPSGRLSSPGFIRRYRKFLAPGGTIHLKTDSRFLHEYTKAVVKASGYPVIACSADIYDKGLPAGAPPADQPFGTLPEVVTAVQTFYETMFLAEGYPITYIAFTPSSEPVEPDFDEKFWKEAEGGRRSFSHAPHKKP